MPRYQHLWLAIPVIALACAQNPAGTTGDAGSYKSFGGDGGSTSGSSDGGAVSCKPRTCAEAGAGCGSIGDGCGGTVTSCGSCSNGDTCGGGGTASQCGTGMTCAPRTCETAGANCGPVANGCGETISCGSCIAPSVCGGETPSVCSGTSAGTCSGLCGKQVSCPNGGTTSLTGIVHAPTVTTTYGAADPLYDALVYVPNGTVEPFTKGVACDRCGAEATGDPLIQTSTGADGKFTLTNVPVGADIPLVIQLGRWRRQIVIPMVTACQDNVLSDEQVRMPRNSTEGDIPLIAMATGQADPMECVLRKIGIADSEFTAPGGGGRVEMYYGNGAQYPRSTTAESSLTGSLSTLENYDMVVLACWGSATTTQTENGADLSNLVAYSNAGGRVFATHFSYVWLYNNSPFDTTATWDQSTMNSGMGGGGGGGGNASVTADVDQSFARGVAFATWLVNVGASTTLGNVALDQVKHDVDAVNGSNAQRWLYDSTQPFHYTFNTPVGAAAGDQCGRVLFSDFHAADSSAGGGGGGFGGGSTFPDECDTNPMTPQEKVLEFMLFDLSSCVPPPGKM